MSIVRRSQIIIKFQCLSVSQPAGCGQELLCVAKKRTFRRSEVDTDNQAGGVGPCGITFPRKQLLISHHCVPLFSVAAAEFIAICSHHATDQDILTRVNNYSKTCPKISTNMNLQESTGRAGPITCLPAWALLYSFPPNRYPQSAWCTTPSCPCQLFKPRCLLFLSLSPRSALVKVGVPRVVNFDACHIVGVGRPVFAWTYRMASSSPETRPLGRARRRSSTLRGLQAFQSSLPDVPDTEDLYMYHVTNYEAMDGSVHPGWSHLRLSCSNDERYDGELTGLPVVSMTTTTYKHSPHVRKMPTISTYPRRAENGSVHYRVSLPLPLHDYRLFLIKASCSKEQRHILCLPRHGRFIHEDILLSLFERTGEELTGPDYGGCFPGGKANNYSDTKFYVDVHFPRPMPLLDRGVYWDTVKKRMPGGTHARPNGPSAGGKKEETLSERLMTWMNGRVINEVKKSGIFWGDTAMGVVFDEARSVAWKKIQDSFGIPAIFELVMNNEHACTSISNLFLMM